MTTDITTQPHPSVLPPGAGQHVHVLNHLATVKVAPGDSGLLAVVEFLAPRGFGPPLHRHRDEDELFIIHEGALHLECGDVREVAEEGSVAHLPAGRPHTFQVRSATARFTCVTASRSGAPRFAAMMAALGTPTDVATLPPVGPIDPDAVAEVCAAHGVDVVGPPPAVPS